MQNKNEIFLVENITRIGSLARTEGEEKPFPESGGIDVRRALEVKKGLDKSPFVFIYFFLILVAAFSPSICGPITDSDMQGRAAVMPQRS